MTLVRYGRTMSAVALTAVLCSRSAPGQGASRDAVETVAIRVHEGTTLSFDLSPDGRSIEGDLGTIAVGKLADLVLLDADPLADIHNTRRIRAVIQAGRLVDRPGIVERFRHQ